MDPAILAAVGAFLSGLTSAVAAFFAIRFERRRGERVCEQRLDAFRQGLDYEKGET